MEVDVNRSCYRDRRKAVFAVSQGIKAIQSGADRRESIDDICQRCMPKPISARRTSMNLVIRRTLRLVGSKYVIETTFTRRIF